MANRFGQAYGLTLLTPIIGGNDERGIRHDLAVREVLLALNDIPAGVFAKVPTTHMARWVVIDDPTFEGIPATLDHFASKYLIFTSNFDAGSKTDDAALREYLELMRTAIGDTLTRLYRHCVGFPGIEHADAFAAYMIRCQITASFFFGAYPHASVRDVLRALDAQRRMGDFVAATQASRPAPEQLKQQFDAFMAALVAAETPRPGTI